MKVYYFLVFLNHKTKFAKKIDATSTILTIQHKQYLINKVLKNIDDICVCRVYLRFTELANDRF